MAALLSACASDGLSGGSAPRATPATAAPMAGVGGFIAAAPEGAVTVVDDPIVGGRVEVTAGRTYRAASGRDCRRFNTVALDGDRTVRSWAMCRAQDGPWELVTAGAAEMSVR
ncbi:MAG: DVU3141 family protein [Rhodospirillaceae bacterium]